MLIIGYESKGLQTVNAVRLAIGARCCLYVATRHHKCKGSLGMAVPMDFVVKKSETVDPAPLTISTVVPINTPEVDKNECPLKNDPPVDFWGCQ